MGQGYSLTTLSAGSAGIDVPELADLSYEKSLGDARFMKAIRARHQDGLVVIKVVMKPYASMSFAKYIKAIKRERTILADIPNALAYRQAFETTSNGYLIRQYMYSSVYDRMSTRPFLEDIEKRWLAFQLLNAVRDCHAQDLFHGDIKTENTLVTSWNWLYLTDFSSSFKPAYLPEDNPADFSFYFDISGRRTCYLAPERFSERPNPSGEVNWAMDIFSVGCVIAEIFLETPIFTLSQLFKYKRHEFNPEANLLSRIEDPDVRELVAHMIQLEPESRYSADEYLNFWRRKAFPEYFYSFLHQYMYVITDPSSGRAAMTAGQANLGESDERIDRVHLDYDKICYFLDSEDDIQRGLTTKRKSNSFLPSSRIETVPVMYAPNSRPISDDGTLLFLNIVTSALRSTARASARVRACELLLAFSSRLTDDAKLDRVLPYVMLLINDSANIVRVSAVRTLAQLLSSVDSISPLNAYLFPEYILPRLEVFTPAGRQTPDAFVRAAYASCLASLAESAAHSLDVTQALKAEGSLPTSDPEADDGILVHAMYQNLFDFARADLVKFFEAQTQALLTDPDPDVRRAFLGSVSRLCVYLGSTKANDVVLSHLNTYLNDRDWRLKCSFFDTIVGVAVYVGPTSLEEFILPLMIPAIADPEETVVEKVIRSLATMAELGLFQRPTTWQLLNLIGRFTMHPDIWIREAAVYFISSSTKYLSIADIQCLLRPIIQPFLRVAPEKFSETNLLECLRDPFPRLVFDMAVTWASSSDRTGFWKVGHRSMFTALNENRSPIASVNDVGPQHLNRLVKKEQDISALARLRAAGLTPEHEFKLLALKDYISRIAHAKSAGELDPNIARLNSIVRLKDLDITPQTIFFNHEQGLIDADDHKQHLDAIEEQPQALTDAILDASRDLEDDAIDSQKVVSTPSKKISNPRSTTRSDLPKSGDSSSPQTTQPTVPDNGVDSRANTPMNRQNSTDSGTASLRSDRGVAHDNHINRKTSAMDLLQRRVSSTKSFPETGTSSANAFGKVDVVSVRGKPNRSAMGLAGDNAGFLSGRANHQAGHTYDGNDPSVLKLLDTMYMETYPLEAIDFGPLVQPIERRVWEKKPDLASTRHWRPEGILVAMFGEHTAAVNRIVVAPDHSFFLTGSDDGSIRVWDCSRLERNLANRSRQMYRHAAGAKVTSLTFLGNTYCFASAATDGSVYIIKVDYSETTQGNGRYGKLKLLRQWQVPKSTANESASPDQPHGVWIEHVKTENQSLLLIATNTSQIHALDLKTMTILYTLENPLHHGAPTCFCVDPRTHWLLVGTTHGVLDLWDLRFRLRLRAWGFPAAAPIHRLLLHPIRGTKKKQVCVAGGTGGSEMTVWDLEKLGCKEVYRIVSQERSASGSNQPANTGIARDTLKPYLPWHIDAERSDSMLSRFSLAEGAKSSISDAKQADQGLRAITVATRPAAESQERRHGVFVGAGSDRKVRFWDMDQVEKSCVVSGLDAGEPKPTYTETQFGGEMTFYSCVESTSFGADGHGNRSSGSANGKGKPAAGRKKDGANAATQKPPRSTVISLQQQQLLRSHLDLVLDVALLEYPFNMVVSADRSGVVYVFR